MPIKRRGRERRLPVEKEKVGGGQWQETVAVAGNENAELRLDNRNSAKYFTATAAAYCLLIY